MVGILDDSGDTIGEAVKVPAALPPTIASQRIESRPPQRRLATDATAKAIATVGMIDEATVDKPAKPDQPTRDELEQRRGDQLKKLQAINGAAS